LPELAFVAPTTAEEAVKALAAGGGKARALAGGTDLLVQMKAGRVKPSTIVDLKRIPGMIGIRESGGGFVIGAATPGAVLAEHAALAAAWPGVVEGANLIGSTQIQGRATLAGNLCNASPAADTIPALIAARAVCVLAGPDGPRELPVENFCTGPGQTALRRGELLVSLRLLPPLPQSGSAYLRFIPRNEMDIAVVGAGVAVALEGGRTHCTAARVALAAVAPTPLLVHEAGEALVGGTLTDDDLERAATRAQAAARPISDLRGDADFRRHLVGVLVKRALKIAIARAKER